MPNTKLFKTILQEGGNVCANGVQAKPLDISDYSPKQLDELKSILKSFLLEMNNIFKTEFGKPLWKKSLVTNNKIFSGSTRNLFEQPAKEFLQYKKSLGDIDVFTSLEFKENFGNILIFFNDNVIKGVEIEATKKNEWVDQNHFIISIPKLGIKNLQLDFEFGEFKKNGDPEDFTYYSHYSSWEDMQNGIKGAFNKILLRVIAESKVLHDKIIISSKTGQVLRNNQYSICPIVFDVDNGIGRTYKPKKDKNGKIKTFRKKEIWEKLYELEYDIDLDIIFEELFDRKPKGKEATDIYSFSRLCPIIKTLDKKRQEIIYDNFVYDLFGSVKAGMFERAQAHDRRDVENDISLKLSALNKFEQIYGIQKDLFGEYNLQALIEMYREESRGTEIQDI